MLSGVLKQSVQLSGTAEKYSRTKGDAHYGLGQASPRLPGICELFTIPRNTLFAF